ncbi:hypothetical protein PIROE2DRAFT_8282 [Piromyces sp. E2]|nr:hypothetical protein PIROE2DRAFT_8282 [Piromyces sp. E2]|eukprot:OUM64824.1 hypothetical protein PIROE2DRAFT_8282 [Piromyces sp. E2]
MVVPRINSKWRFYCEINENSMVGANRGILKVKKNETETETYKRFLGRRKSDTINTY